MLFRSDEATALSRRGMQSRWRAVAEMMLDCDYYPITECRGSTEDWCVAQFDNPVTRHGFVLLIRNADAEEDSFLLKLPYIGSFSPTYTLIGDSWFKEYCKDDISKGIEVKLKKHEATVIFYGYSM